VTQAIVDVEEDRVPARLVRVPVAETEGGREQISAVRDGSPQLYIPATFPIRFGVVVWTITFYSEGS
jgi:hypothetical protein